MFNIVTGMRRLGAWLIVSLAVGLGVTMASGQQPRYDPFAAKSVDNPPPEPPQAAIPSLVVEDQVTRIFRILSDATGWSFVVSPEVTSKPPRINLYVKNMTPDQILQQIAVLGGLVVDRKGNVVSIMTFDEHARMFGLEKSVVVLRNTSAKLLAESLRPFADTGDKNAARIIADETSNKLILLMPRPLLESLLKLVESLDVPLEAETLRVVPVTHLQASAVVPALEAFLQDSRTANASEASRLVPKAGPAPATSAPANDPSPDRRLGDVWRVQFMLEPRLNVIVLRGRPADVAKVEALIGQLDVDPGVQAISYPLKYTDAQQLYETLQAVMESASRERTSRSAAGAVPAERMHVSVSGQNNLILVEGNAADHQWVRQIIEALDKPMAGSGGTKVYRLDCASSAEVVKVLTSIVDSRTNGKGAAVRDRTNPQQGPRDISPAGSEGSVSPPGPAPAPDNGGSNPEAGPTGAADLSVAQISEAPGINAVIIRASATDQETFEQVIRQLDRPREQVMLEVTMVTIRGTKFCDIGVELGAARLSGWGAKMVGFTNLDFGAISPATGVIRPSVSTGGLNYALFNNDDYSLVINALKSTGDLRITSSPKVLAEDNSLATIAQVEQEPYAVTNVVNGTVVTAFGGYVDAGITLNVVPHISSKEWLRLEIDVVLSTFDGAPAGAVAMPPARLRNQLQGIVRIPAEHTVVLGGLVSSQSRKNVKGVPLISDIPILGEAFKRQTDEQTFDTLFIFIRPVVLRDTKFQDLLSLTRTDMAAVDLQPGEPKNQLKLVCPQTQPASEETK